MGFYIEPHKHIHLAIYYDDNGRSVIYAGSRSKCEEYIETQKRKLKRGLLIHVSKTVMKWSMTHASKKGSGAAKRRLLTPKQKIAAVMREFKRGTLYSGSGQKVTDREQAIAIALSESRKVRK